MQFKKALISVSDKTGLVEALKPLVKNGMQVISTGGTAKHLRDHGITVTDVSEQTGFPEVMGGRVKTLHPRVHMGLLYREEDRTLLTQESLEPFDLVIVNLYPFEQALQKKLSDEEMIENIDVGGPSMLRAAAKNFERVVVMCDPKDYALLTMSSFTVSDRRSLAAKVFAHTSRYDSLITNYLTPSSNLIYGELHDELRYGENPHQKAQWYKTGEGLHQAQILQGKQLSYNNVLDLHAALDLCAKFSEPSVVAVKHNNPCGASSNTDFSKALEKALKADPKSVFGGIIACNRAITKVSEAQMLADLFLECLVAPGYSEEVLQIFSKKKNFRVLQWPDFQKHFKNKEFKNVAGGFLVQDSDQLFEKMDGWQFIGEKPNAEILKDMVFGEKVAASLKSNAIALVESGTTLGLGMGQVNRVDSVKHAIERALTNGQISAQTVVISDAFFPFADSLDIIYQAGIKWVLQPGGSVKDNEVIARAQELKMNLVLTGVRHFKH